MQPLSLQLNWKIGSDMPAPMSTHIQSVEIHGTIYVGGGVAGLTKYDYVVMAYNTKSCQWSNLPSYNTRGFAMTALNNKLVLVSGQTIDDTYSKELGVFQSDSNQWTHPFSPIPMPRWCPSAISHEHWIIVAGGSRYGYASQRVDILDTDNNQWFVGPSIPVPWDNMKSTVIEECWYLMGGWYGSGEEVLDVYRVPLDDLVANCTSSNSKVWNKLTPSLNFAFSAPLGVKGSLLSVGGKDLQTMLPTSAIWRYVPETSTWIQAGELPLALYNCTCITMSHTIHLIGGWEGKHALKKYFTCIL